MIEEEDDEAILNKGTSFKSVIKHLFVIVLILFGIFIIYFGTGGDQVTNFIIGFMIICVASTISQIQKQPPEPIRQTLSILICGLCGITKVRNYEQGDFVYKNSIDTCDKCNESMQIKQIYSVKLKQPTEPNKEEDKKKTQTNERESR